MISRFEDDIICANRLIFKVVIGLDKYKNFKTKTTKRAALETDL